MIKLKDLLDEGTATPGVLEGWLDPNGTCYFVPDTHPEWAARYLKTHPPNPDDIGAHEARRVYLLRQLYDKKWVRINIIHSENLLYFDTYNTPWQSVSRVQRKWLQLASFYGVRVEEEKIMVLNDMGDLRNPPYTIKFGNVPNDKVIDPGGYTSMISFSKIMNEVLTERNSFRNLLAGSEPGRKKRGRTDVKARSIRVATIDENEAWLFNYKSNPSTTGERWHGFVKFFKEDVSNKDSVQDIDCQVDCDCPDYRYRYAYNNAQADVGDIRSKPSSPPRSRAAGGVGDYGVGMCKHLCSLGEYLKTKIEPDAPQPGEPEAPTTKPPQISKDITPETPTTTDAPNPEDGYTDSRTGLEEGNRSLLFGRIDEFVRNNPEFDVSYD